MTLKMVIQLNWMQLHMVANIIAKTINKRTILSSKCMYFVSFELFLLSFCIFSCILTQRIFFMVFSWIFVFFFIDFNTLLFKLTTSIAIFTLDKWIYLDVKVIYWFRKLALIIKNVTSARHLSEKFLIFKKITFFCFLFL